jgi:DNA/RNA endonuclease YhcR with UshA esterase domain
MAARALKGKKGLYASDEYTVIDHAKAGEYIGKKVVVAGMIRDIHKSEKAVQLNFGVDWRTDFTAVIFRDSLERFEELNLVPAKFKGRYVYVIGKVKEYNGPEIIVRWPTQILPLPAETSSRTQDP